eukprot:987719-Rhodomonas_salina.1
MMLPGLAPHCCEPFLRHPILGRYHYAGQPARRCLRVGAYAYLLRTPVLTELLRAYVYVIYTPVLTWLPWVFYVPTRLPHTCTRTETAATCQHAL